VKFDVISRLEKGEQISTNAVMLDSLTAAYVQYVTILTNYTKY